MSVSFWMCVVLSESTIFSSDISPYALALHVLYVQCLYGMYRLYRMRRFNNPNIEQCYFLCFYYCSIRILIPTFNIWCMIIHCILMHIFLTKREQHPYRNNRSMQTCTILFISDPCFWFSFTRKTSMKVVFQNLTSYYCNEHKPPRTRSKN